MSSAAPVARRSQFARATERVRFDLVTQEDLAWMAKAGLLFHPDVVVEEPRHVRPDLARQLRSFTLRQLLAADAHVIASLRPDSAGPPAPRSTCVSGVASVASSCRGFRA